MKINYKPWRDNTKNTMQNSKARLKILFIPAWYPSGVNPINPVEGVFIKEHAKAVSLYDDIIVLYARLDPNPQPHGFYRVSEETEEGIRTIRIRYGGILSYLWRKIKSGKQTEDSSNDSQPKSKTPVNILGFPARTIISLVRNWSIFWTFRMLIRKGWRPDVIHAHVFKAGVAAVIIGKLYRIPVVITEHSSDFPRHLLTLSDRTMARFAMNRAGIILPVSDDLRQHIETYGIKNKFRVVPNTVNTEIFYPDPLNNEAKRNKETRLLFVGSTIPVKGIPYLLEALSQIKEKRQDFTLDIVGDGANRREYEETTATLGLQEMVKFHGFKPKQEIAKFMRDCDFFVLPSLWENLPCVLIEVTSCGKPVVASDVGGIKEIINQENGILVPAKDTKALKRAIEYMLDNQMNYSQVQIARNAKKKFNYETVGKMLDEVYREVSNNGC